MIGESVRPEVSKDERGEETFCEVIKNEAQNIGFNTISRRRKKNEKIHDVDDCLLLGFCAGP
jgi:hypothetical protein